jgi:threonylcarbamoyladenosine tRNA methylthiotransferase MtaB
VIAGEERFMPHLHLSLQAGDDLVLKRMKRRHGRDDAIKFCREVRALRPNMVLGADIIAGFPTETEDMFARSLDLVEACGLTHLHVFPFSPREGTPAARMPQVPREAARERAARLREKGEHALRGHLAAQTGRRLEFLTERGGVGRARDFTLARMPDAPAGKLVEASVAGHDGRALLLA